MSDGDIQVRPSDEDRTRVINLLRGASGRLGLEEAERRMDAAVAAPTRADLALLVWDLPDVPGTPAPERPTISAWRSTTFRAHAIAYGMVNGMLVGIYELTTPHGFFWPFFPIAGWGIGVVFNAFGVRASQRHQYEKRVKRLEKRARGELPPFADRPALPVGGDSVGGDWRPAQTGRHTRAHGPSPRGAGRARSAEARPARVVVMFTDVVDSTRLTMVIGDQDWSRVRARYRKLLTDAYKNYGGQEVSAQGDGFLARFHRPGDAVQCAVDIQRRLEEQRHEFGFAPAVRIGINAGDAIEEEGDVLGTTVNIASRVTSAADPNEILVTETVADQLDDRFQLKDGGLRQMKGLDRQAHVLIVTW